MSNTFLISDTHWGHDAAVRHFKREDGTPLRDFESAEACDEYMVEQWNLVVGPRDKVYHLGDVVMPKNHRRLDEIMPRLNGDKVLIKGNHDIFKLEDYTPYFRDIRGYHVMNNMILSHIPVHPESFGRFRANIHGHLHQRRVMCEVWGEMEVDPRYFNVSVEQTDFRPILFEEVCKRIKEQQGE